MENKDKPAFGGKKYVDADHPMLDGYWQHVNGLTKREYFAAKALIGILSSPTHCSLIDGEKSVAKVAISIADELLKQLENE